MLKSNYNYRQRKSNRLRGFNYAQDRLYFITTCVQDRACIFGEVIPAKFRDQYAIDGGTTQKHIMVLNECGTIAQQQWYWLEQQYMYVRLHAHIVMPNHVHGVIEINRDLILGHRIHGPGDQSENIKIKSLSELIGAYKTTSSKQIHLLQAEDKSYPYQSFRWQRSFHDHIIRNQKEYNRIISYIEKNPDSWHRDEFR